jgi:hypothetical protein
VNYKTSDKHFRFFQSRFLHWQKELGLTNYKAYFSHEKDDSSFAWINVNEDGRVCTVWLNKVFTEEPTLINLELHAFHEVCELLLWDMSSNLTCTFSLREVAKMTHDVIRRLESLILKQGKG